jgi:hypothetical protein
MSSLTQGRPTIMLLIGSLTKRKTCQSRRIPGQRDEVSDWSSIAVIRSAFGIPHREAAGATTEKARELKSGKTNKISKR